MKYITLLFFLFLTYTSIAQKANVSTLTLPEIMKGEQFVGYLPERVSWSADSEAVYFSWNPEMDTIRRTYKYENGVVEKVTVEELQARATNFQFSKDRSKIIYVKNGDLFMQEVDNKTVHQITNTIERESNIAFSGDEKHILFNKNNNFFAWSIEDGSIHQMTNFKSGSADREGRSSEQEQWLKDDQMELFDILKDNATRQAARDHQNEQLEPHRPAPYYYGKKRISSIQASPDLKFVTFRLTTSVRSKRTKVPDFVTESGYLDDLNARSKVGTPQNTYEFGVYDMERDTHYLIDTEQISGIFDKPAFLEAYHSDDTDYKDQYNFPKEVILLGPVYSDGGKAMVVIRSQDNKDRWIMELKPASGELTLLDHQRDDAWIGGPGISSWNFSTGNVGWLSENTIWFQSEETGYSHLYTLNLTTGKKNALTAGQFEIRDAQLSGDKTIFYITANKENPHEQHFYHLPAKGGKMVKITEKVGNYQVTLSPDEAQIAYRYSYSNQPWELFVQENKAGATPKQVTTSTTEAFNAYDWRVPEIVRFTAEDGAKVPARIYKPANPNGAAVIFVHGAGYLQNVHHWWSSYYREYMFHNMLVDHGYTVLDIDYRASDGYGRDWRTGIYQWMGGKDLSDQIDGAQYLVDAHGIDADRIGIYGGSYGGFITLMALFNSPGTFKCGAALRSVTDWAHYNHGYTSNILNTPVEDPTAYKKSSPIYFAEGLEDRLLILHGMVDTNVQFQDVVRLAQRLIELGKENWEFAVFPVEGHGFREAASWTDEYRRIFELFEEELK